MNSFGWSPSDCEGTSLILFVCAKRWMLWCDVMGREKGRISFPPMGEQSVHDLVGRIDSVWIGTEMVE